MAMQVVVLALLFQTASTLRFFKGSTSDQLCFAKPPGDKIMKMLEFMPEMSESFSKGFGHDDAAAAEAVQQLFLDKSAKCEVSTQPNTMPNYGVGSSLAATFNHFTHAWVEEQKLPQSPTIHWGKPHGMEDFGMKAFHSECEPKQKVALEEEEVTSGRRRKGASLGVQVPTEYEDKGLFWWTSQEANFMFRPHDEFKQEIDALKRNLSWEANRPILGMHVRHGDSCLAKEAKRTARKCDGLDVYMKEAKKMKEKYGYKSIFLATDDVEVVEATKDYPEFKWLYRPELATMAKNHLNSKWETQDIAFDDKEVLSLGFDRDDKPIDFAQVAQDYMKDVLMMGDADGLVGKFTSNVARLAVTASYGQKKCLYPFISMDAYWCNAFGTEAGYVPSTNQHFKC